MAALHRCPFCFFDSASEDRPISFGWTIAAECLIVPCALLLALGIGANRIATAGRNGLRRGSRSQWQSIAIVMLLAVGISVCVTMIRTPFPRIHDEFSYLLAADMFAMGRVAMPKHPMWEHFETFHVLVQPNYASKYPPAQGLFLALGQLLGSPIVGVWLSTALAAGASCWMLQGWLPKRWAFLGGLLICVSYTVMIRWGQSYWGGAPAMIGGALLCGGFARHVRAPNFIATLAMLLGAAMLATTRPYEGGVLCVVIALHILVASIRQGRIRERDFWTKFVAPGMVGSGVLLGGLALYNVAITGSWSDFPHSSFHRQYAATPVFQWQSPPPEPTYRHEVIRDFWTGWGAEAYKQQQHPSIYFTIRSQASIGMLFSFFGVSLVIPLLSVSSVRKRRGALVALHGISAVLVGSAFVPWVQRHYLAPILPVAYLLLLHSIRQFYAAKPCRRKQRAALATACLVGAVAALLLRVTYEVNKREHWGAERARIERDLEQQPGDDLIVVRYANNHKGLDEWVYNKADIDNSPIIWAREMSPAKNLELLRHFSKRRHWLLLADTKPPRLIEHTGGRKAGGSGEKRDETTASSVK